MEADELATVVVGAPEDVLVTEVAVDPSVAEARDGVLVVDD